MLIGIRRGKRGHVVSGVIQITGKICEIFLGGGVGVGKSKWKQMDAGNSPFIIQFLGEMDWMRDRNWHFSGRGGVSVN